MCVGAFFFSGKDISKIFMTKTVVFPAFAKFTFIILFTSY